MTDPLINRLQTWAYECEEQHGPGMWSQDMRLAADRIEELEKHFEHAISIFSLMRDELYVVGEVMKAFPDE